MREVPQPGVFARLLRRQDPERAYVEITNRLARSSVADIKDGWVAEVLDASGLTLAEAKPRLKQFYRLALQASLADQELTDEEVAHLRRLRDLFGLVNRDVRDVEAELYQGAVRRGIADQQVSAEDRAVALLRAVWRDTGRRALVLRLLRSRS